MSERSFHWVAVAVLALGVSMPLFLRYLPAADLPQHLAVAAIAQQLEDPSLNLAAYFELDLSRTLYFLPYVLCLALGKLVGLRLGMHAVVVLGSACYLGGIALLLRARGQPAWLALLALPFVYNRAFFWGFINFNLGVGLGLLAIGLMLRPTSRRAEQWLAGICAALSVLTHVYGVVLLLAFASAWALWDLEAVRARWRALLPASGGLLAWLVLIQSAPAVGRPLSPPLGYRLSNLPSSILGGYADDSEALLLTLTVGLALWLARVPLSLSGARARAMPVLDKVLWLGVAANLVLYFVLPQDTERAGFIHFRHAVLAAAFLPALARADLAAQRWRRAAPLGIAVLSLGVTGGHLVAFDQEARGFDAALAAAPTGARVVYLPIDSNGEWLHTWPYLHFGAFLQAEKGGFVAQSFPQLFWNIPVKTRAGAVPRLAPGLEFTPERFDDGAFEGFFDYALVRIPEEAALEPSARFPFVRTWAQPPWHLYRRAPNTPGAWRRP